LIIPMDNSQEDEDDEDGLSFWLHPNKVRRMMKRKAVLRKLPIEKVFMILEHIYGRYIAVSGILMPVGHFVSSLYLTPLKLAS